MSKDIWVCITLGGKVFNYKFNFSHTCNLLQFSISCVSGIMSFKEFVHFKFIGIQLFRTTLYYASTSARSAESRDSSLTPVMVLPLFYSSIYPESIHMINFHKEPSFSFGNLLCSLLTISLILAFLLLFSLLILGLLFPCFSNPYCGIFVLVLFLFQYNHLEVKFPSKLCFRSILHVLCFVFIFS